MDVLTATIDWGDGTEEPGVVERSGPNGTIAGSHVYADDGTFAVKITLSDDGGGSDQDVLPVEVTNVAPQITLGGADTVVEAELYELTLSSSDPGDDTITGWSINWGDGSQALVVTGSTTSVSHVYADGPGNHTISVAATDEDGTFNADGAEVTVQNVAPTLTISGPGTGDEGSTYELTLSSSDPGDDTITGWSINWGDGSPALVVTGSTTSVSHVYGGGPANHTISARATDEDGTFDSNTIQLAIKNIPPTVEAGDGQTVDEGEAVSLAPSTFNDLGTEDSHTATIDWGDGTGKNAAVVSETPFGPPGSTSGADGSVSGSHVYGDNDTYTVSVCVKDEGAETCDTLKVTVENVAPTVEAGDGQTVDEGEAVSLAPSTFNDLGTEDSHTATIDWGDGTGKNAAVVSETPFGPPGSTSGADGSVSGSHVYGDNDTYTVSVCIKDEGAETCDTLKVTVENVAPTVEAGDGQTVDEGEAVSLAPSTFNDLGTEDSHTATIDWGDGTGKNAAVVSETPVGPPGSTSGADGSVSGSHVYGDNGTYTVSVCVKDDGAETCDTLEVTVENVAPTVDALTLIEIDEGDNASFMGHATDPGSDDLTFSWTWGSLPGCSLATTYFSAPPTADPPQSAQVNPRDATATAGCDYGDNGLFIVTLTVSDDDGGNAIVTTTVSVVNLDPKLALDKSDAVLLSGGSTFLGRKGVTQTHSASASDPGSDDITFVWTFAPDPAVSEVTYLNGPGSDPVLSPDGIFSFSVGDSADVTFGAPGVYTVFVSIADDDGGSTSDSLPKVVTDDCDCTEGKGFWKQEYSDKGKAHTDEASRQAYLDIVNFASGVLDEGVPLTTFGQAHLILSGKGGAPAAPEAPGTVTQEVSTGDKKKEKKDKNDKGNKDKGSGGGSALGGGSGTGGADDTGSIPAVSKMRGQALAQTLTAWLNFAKGALELDEDIVIDPGDTGSGSGSGGASTPPVTMAFQEIMDEVEAILNNPDATKADLEHAKDLAESVNMHDKGNPDCDTDTGSGSKSPSGSGSGTG